MSRCLIVVTAWGVQDFGETRPSPSPYMPELASKGPSLVQLGRKMRLSVAAGEKDGGCVARAR